MMQEIPMIRKYNFKHFSHWRWNCAAAEIIHLAFEFPFLSCSRFCVLITCGSKIKMHFVLVSEDHPKMAAGCGQASHPIKCSFSCSIMSKKALSRNIRHLSQHPEVIAEVQGHLKTKPSVLHHQLFSVKLHRKNKDETTLLRFWFS